MWDWLGYAESHKGIETAFVSVLFILLCVLSVIVFYVWRKHTKAGKKIHEIMLISQTIQSLLTQQDKQIALVLENAADIAETVSKRFWKSCQEMRCPKIDELTNKFEEQNKCLHRFVEDAKTSRELTADAVRRIEHGTNLFINEIGREMLRRVNTSRESG